MVPIYPDWYPIGKASTRVEASDTAWRVGGVGNGNDKGNGNERPPKPALEPQNPPWSPKTRFKSLTRLTPWARAWGEQTVANATLRQFGRALRTAPPLLRDVVLELWHDTHGAPAWSDLVTAMQTRSFADPAPRWTDARRLL